MKTINKILIFGTLASTTVCKAYKIPEKRESQPNFIFILTDDQSSGYMGFEGNHIIKTPHLDELARAGIFFSNAYITSGICTPSRVSMLTGQYERKHGVNFNSGTSLSPDAWEKTFPVILRNGGYYTGYVGKNHSPVGDGGYESGLMESSFDYWYGAHNRLEFYPKRIHPIFKSARYDTQVEIIEEGSLDFLSNEHRLEGAIRFLNQRPTNKPFILSINLNLPHNAGTGTMEQRESDKEIYKSLYRDANIPLPPNYVAKADIVTPKLPADIHFVENRQPSYFYVDNPDDLRETIIRQYQAITGIDGMVGKIREVLAKQKLDKNTIIIFTSDHGLFMGQFGLGGKGLCYQVCTNVPMIIYDPKAPLNAKGLVTNELVQSIDIAPTILSLAGMQIPDEMQGRDISPMIYGNLKPLREYIFTENLWSTHFGNPRIEAVQDKEWKYIRYYRNNNIPAREKMRIANEMGIPRDAIMGVSDIDIAIYRGFVENPLRGEPAVYEELYNLSKDPNETTNLIDDPAYTVILNTMKTAWWNMLKEARGEGPPKVLRYIKN